MRKRSVSTDTTITIALIQMATGPDPDRNLARAVRMVEDAACGGARIICLPELFRTRYFPQDIRSEQESLAETIPGPSSETFSQIAQENNCVIIVPVYEKTGDCRFYNAAVVIDADGSYHTPYHKVHIPQDPGFYEKGYFYPGDSYPVYHTRYGCIAVLICYDQWFPEAARSVALQGASIIFYPTAIGDPVTRSPEEGAWRPAWELIQRSHAIANSVHVASVNRVGTEGDIDFFGGSFICDSFGNIISSAGRDEKIIIATVDLSTNELIRDSWGFFRNRRPDTYGNVCKVNPVGISSLEYDWGTPRNRGFAMPAEWEPHQAVWLSWPRSDRTFPHLESVGDTYISLISELKGSEQVNLIVPDLSTATMVQERLVQSGSGYDHVNFRTADYADVWIRDYGPTFVINPATRQKAMVRWNFNAWGGKYEDLIKDGSIPEIMNSWLGFPIFVPDIVLEGGSIDVNGRGTVLTTRSCLLHPNRNPSRSEYEIEEILKEYLGCTHVIWLDEGIAGDDTDGHVDDIARFTGPSTVVCAFEDDESDENYPVLLKNYEILKRSTDQNGNSLKVIRLPMPSGVRGDGSRYPASYANFYIGNSVVIVPVFNDPNDEVAIGILQELFPGRKVTGINASAMIEGYGAFHCCTQQQPE